MMIGIVVDSNSQMPPSLAQRYGIRVVPLTVTLDGVEFLEGVDLDADAFYNAWADGQTPIVATSQPSPGAFIEAYEDLIAAGATEILSIHIADSMSGTLNSARIAADNVPVDVRLVDSGTASFGISCCAWAAAEALASGATVEAAAAVAEQQAAKIGTAFVVGVPGLIDRSGRADGAGVAAAAAAGIPVIAMAGGTFEVIDTVSSVGTAVTAMSGYARAWSAGTPSPLRVAVGTSDTSSQPLAVALTRSLEATSTIDQIVQYVIGPSVGAHTGPGTAGLFVF